MGDASAGSVVVCLRPCILIVKRARQAAVGYQGTEDVRTCQGRSRAVTAWLYAKHAAVCDVRQWRSHYTIALYVFISIEKLVYQPLKKTLIHQARAE